MSGSKTTVSEVVVPESEIMVMRWANAFEDHFHSCIGTSKAPLAWIICSEVAVPAISPRALNLPHSAGKNSIEGDLIARLSHTNPLPP